MWLAKYIDHNTQKRTEAKTNFEKDLYKLENKAFFGKTMENVRDRIKLDSIPHSKYGQKLKRQSKLTFKGIENPYSELSVCEYGKGSKVFDKPKYLGFCVLELSQLLMYEFYYDKFLVYGGNTAQLHNMDTDTFILSIKTKNLKKT